MNELRTTKPTQKLENYIFIKDIIKIESEADMESGFPPLTITIQNYNSSMVLCLLKDNIVKDIAWIYLNKQEQIKKTIVARGMIQTYQPRYFFRYKMPDTKKIITIECGEYFLIDYYDNKKFKRDIKELKKIAVELKGG